MIDNIDIPKHIINKIIENALAEDLGSFGDITSKSLSNEKINDRSINKFKPRWSHIRTRHH